MAETINKYTLDVIEPNNGFTLETMTENGDYQLWQIGKYSTLYKAIRALDTFMIADEKNRVERDYDLRIDGEVFICTINKKIVIE